MRGATNQIHKLTTESIAKGISKPRFVTWSGGNYGKAFALANKHMGNEGLVCIQEAAPIARRAMLQSLGMQVKAAPTSELLSLVKWHAENEGMIRAEPFDDLSLIAAYASITYEIVQALNGNPPDILLAPIGGGGLISGIAAGLRLAGHTSTKIYGVEPETANVMSYSFEHGRPMNLPTVKSVATGTCSPVAGQYTYAICKAYLNGILLVSDEEIVAAMKALFEKGILCEPTGAVAMAAVLSKKIPEKIDGKSVVVVLSGSNVTWTDVRDLLKLE